MRIVKSNRAHFTTEDTEIIKDRQDNGRKPSIAKKTFQSRPSAYARRGPASRWLTETGFTAREPLHHEEPDDQPIGPPAVPQRDHSRTGLDFHLGIGKSQIIDLHSYFQHAMTAAGHFR